MRFFVLGQVLALGVVSAFVLSAGTQPEPVKKPENPRKRRIAAFNFDNAFRPSSPNDMFAVLQGSAPDLGKAAADLVITRRVQDGQVTVLERNAIDKLIA